MNKVTTTVQKQKSDESKNILYSRKLAVSITPMLQTDTGEKNININRQYVHNMFNEVGFAHFLFFMYKNV